MSKKNNEQYKFLLDDPNYRKYRETEEKYIDVKGKLADAEKCVEMLLNCIYCDKAISKEQIEFIQSCFPNLVSKIITFKVLTK